MARIKVTDTITGKKGTIEEKDFNPARYQKIESPVGKALGAAKNIANFMYPETTKMISDARANPNAPENKPSPLEAMFPQAMLFSGNQKGKMAREVVLDTLLTLAGGKLADWIKGPTKGIKAGTPSVVQASIKSAEDVVGKQIDDIITEAEKKGTKLNLGEVYKKLDELMASKNVSVRPDAVEKVKAIKNMLAGEWRNISKAYGQKMALGQDIYGEAGKELTKRGTAGIAEKNAKKIAGEGLKKAIQESVPEVTGPMKQYESLARLGNEMEKPLQNWWMGGLAGSLGLGSYSATQMGLPGILAPSAIGALVAMPYTRFLGRKALGAAVDYGKYPLMGIINQLRSGSTQPVTPDLNSEYLPTKQ